MNTNANYFTKETGATKSNHKPSVIANDTEDPALLSLWEEYNALVSTLRKQGIRQDVALLMRLTVVMIDLGLYCPSAP